MARTISQTALQAMLAQQTDQIFLVTLQIDHPNLSAPLRFVNDTQDLLKGGNTYTGWPFQIKFPEDTEDNTPRVTISIDNVDQTIIREIRAMEAAPDITIEVVLKSSPDTTELGPFTMELKTVDYDELTISGTISYEEDFLNEPFPADSFTPKTAPGIYA